MSTLDLSSILRLALDAAASSVVITDAALDPPGPEIVYVNRACEAMTGYTAEELIGQTPRILQGPKTERKVLDRLRKDLTEGRPFYGDTINYRKDGAEFHIEWRIAPVRDEAGKTTHFISVQRDITNDRTHEQQLKEQIEELRQTLENRKIIERAKGEFMKITGLDEPSVFRRMQQISSQKNMKLVELAKAILTSSEAFKSAEKS